ncbi:MAG TPA: sarcosine oxidase subunit alpha family protein [Ktedonobacterales bacterium]
MSAWRAERGGRVDRSCPIGFSFDGRPYRGLAGDTLASALLANGVRLLGRSFKYHRPRGLLSAGSEEPNALVTVARDAARSAPNLRATQVEIYEGLRAHSQNRWPSLAWDFGALSNGLAPLFPAGFYYKTFMWPRFAWHRWYEPRIRAAAGLGRAPIGADPDGYAQRYAHCDVLVVGAGAAGLAATAAAARSGARVILCDEQAELGGSLLDQPAARIGGLDSATWLKATLGQLSAQGNVTVLPRTTAFGYFPHNMVGLCERLSDHLAAPPEGLPRERLWQVRAREVVLASGAIERPLVFPGNDRPGVMLVAAARSYLNRYGVRVGARAVVLAGCDSAYAAALELHSGGVAIGAVADVRATPGAAALAAVRSAGIRVIERATVLATAGRLRVRNVTLGTVAPDGTITRGDTLPCDALLMSGGFTPSIHLHSQSRGKLLWRAEEGTFIPGAPAERERSAGAARGLDGLAAAFEDGSSAGLAAASACGFKGEASPPLVAAMEFSSIGAPGALPQPGRAAPAKAFVDWQNDVTSRDLELAMREGFSSIEHVKRYTTTGMATDQGKTSGMNALGIVAERSARTVPEVGLTTFRMPYTPVSFGVLAGYDRGNQFDPVRRTPMHEWAQAHGAVFEDVGLWKRARYFPRGTEDMDAAVARECRGVRSACGLFDASTLGKIEVVGPGATDFMNRMYVNNWTSLAPGRARYGVLLRDDGFIYDDGVVARLAEDRYHVTTTTGGAARVLQLMEDYRQSEWPDLKVWLTSTTEQWAVIAVQGPRARAVIAPLVSGVDLSAGALAHMSAARGSICGAPLLLFRVSFSGELGFEINVPADYGTAVWEAIYTAGQAHGITPYGTEAMHVLRAEKGFIIVGQDTDGTVTPDDVGLAWAIGKTKPDFLGKRSLARPAMRAPGRKQLVGLLSIDCTTLLEEGAQVVATAGQAAPMQIIGHVTSAYASPTLGLPIALAMVADGRSRVGRTVFVPKPGGDIAVQVTSPVFYDPEGARLNG